MVARCRRTSPLLESVMIPIKYAPVTLPISSIAIAEKIVFNPLCINRARRYSSVDDRTPARVLFRARISLPHTGITDPTTYVIYPYASCPHEVRESALGLYA